MNKRCFKKDDIELLCAELGYATTPLFDSDEVSQLFDALCKFDLIGNGEGFQNIVNVESKSKRVEINQVIIKSVREKVINLFIGYKPFIASFAIKYFKGENNVPIHLDWSVLDETKSTSFNVWIPLEDVNINNGSMGVLEKSHEFSYTIRGSLINNIATMDNDRKILENIKKNYLPKSVEMKAGDALIYNHRMAHYSYPNKVDKPRIAISVIMVPENTSLFHYHFEQNNDISVFNLKDDFYLIYDMENHPSKYLKKIDLIPACKVKRIENQLNPLIYVD